MTKAEALQRATIGQSFANYGAIFAGFQKMGIPEPEIKPRENVFTFKAWLALGRVVDKGQHGVRICTWIDTTDKATGETKKRPKATTVFHISQTKPIN